MTPHIIVKPDVTQRCERPERRMIPLNGGHCAMFARWIVDGKGMCPNHARPFIQCNATGRDKMCFLGNHGWPAPIEEPVFPAETQEQFDARTAVNAKAEADPFADLVQDAPASGRVLGGAR